MLRRTFREDLSVCVQCSSKVCIVAFSTDPDELEPLLLRHGEPLVPPIAAPARSAPQLEIDWLTDEPA